MQEENVFFRKLLFPHRSVPAKLIFAFNLLLLVLFITRVDKSSLVFDRYIYRHTAAPFHAYSVGRYPYEREHGYFIQFYKPPGIDIKTRASLEAVLPETDGQQAFFLITSDTNTVSLPAYGPWRVEILYRYEQKDMWSMAEQTLKHEPRFVWTLYRFAL